jgi:hypothetical protein
MNEQIKFPNQDEIRDAVLLVLAFPRNPEAEGSAYLEDLERGVLRVLDWPDDDLTRNEYLTRMFKDPNTGEESHLKDRIWSTIGDLESRGYARVSAHTRVCEDTVVWLTTEGHEQAKVVRAKVVDACLLQRIPPRECQPTLMEEAIKRAVSDVDPSKRVDPWPSLYGGTSARGPIPTPVPIPGPVPKSGNELSKAPPPAPRPTVVVGTPKQTRPVQVERKTGYPPPGFG